MQINTTLLVAVTLVASWIWLGVKGSKPANRWLFILRAALGLITIVLIYGPLQRFRPVIGTIGYVGTALLIAGTLYGIGILASRRYKK